MRCDQHLTTTETDKAKAVLLTLSDPTTEPLENAHDERRDRQQGPNYWEIIADRLHASRWSTG